MVEKYSATQTQVATKVSTKTKVLLGFLIVGCLGGMFAITTNLTKNILVKNKKTSNIEKIKLLDNNQYALKNGDQLEIDGQIIGSITNGTFSLINAEDVVIDKTEGGMSIRKGDGEIGGYDIICKCSNGTTSNCRTVYYGDSWFCSRAYSSGCACNMYITPYGNVGGEINR